MYKKLALLALLMICVTSPVTAYTELWTNAYSGSTTGFGYSPDVLTFSNGLYANQITRYVRYGPTYHFDDNGTFYGGIYSGWSSSSPGLQGTLVGNGSITWNCGNSPSFYYDSMCSYDYNLSITSALPNGPISLRFGTWTYPYTDAYLQMCDAGYCNAKVTGSAPPGTSTVYAATQLSNTGYVFNGSYATYSGSYTPPTPGYNVTTTIHTVDANTGNHIIGSTVNAICAGESRWTNSTTTDGTAAVTCANTDLLDIYLSYPGVYSDVTDFSVTQGGDYYLAMYPITANATIGYTNIFLSVKDKDTGGYVSYASTTATLPSGAVTGDSTGSSGTTLFVVPNNSVIILGASKAGYTSMSKSLNSGSGANIATTIELSKATVPSSTVTPTVTDPGTGLPITAVPTYLPYCNPNSPDYSADRCAHSQDSSMMAQLREWGPTILELCIVAILFWLLASVFQALYKMAGK